MVNLIKAGLIPRIGLATGIFMLWAVLFFALVDTDVDTAENVVLVPVLLSAVLFGVRGGYAAAVIGLLGISTFHVVAGTDVFTTLLHGGSPPDVALLLAVTALVGYSRLLETKRAAANELVTTTEHRLSQLDTEAHLLSQLSIDMGRSTTTESILAAACTALPDVVAFDRMAVYLIGDDRNEVALSYLVGDDTVGPARGDKFSLDEIMGLDPYDRACIGENETPADCVPNLILHHSVNDDTMPIAYFRLWSNTVRELSIHEKDYVRSVTSTITPALKRVSLQAKIERDIEMSSLVSDFAVATHTSLEVGDVVGIAGSYIVRQLRPDFFAMAVADLDARQLAFKQVTGEGFGSFAIGDIRAMADVLVDPISTEGIRVWTIEECEIIKEHSQIARAATESNLDNFIAMNLLHKGELLAQLLIGTESKNGISTADVEFIRRIGLQLVPALHNAIATESVQELQRQLVGQNERLAYMQDTVERAEAETGITNAKLLVLNDSKSQFMSVIAHELKNPLSIIIGYAGLLRLETESLSAEQCEYTELMEKSARRLEVLINDLGAIARNEPAKFSISKTRHNISEVVNEIVDSMKISTLGQNRRVEFTTTAPEDSFVGDPIRLGQVVTNLVTNALKYSSNNAPVEVAFEANSERVKISVTDHGLGISEADQEEMFTPFFRSNNPEALQREGTGLGLALAKSIIEAHGGTLTLTSVLGSGSTFTIELPVAVADEDTEAARAAPNTTMGV